MSPADSDKLFFDGPEIEAVNYCRDGCPQIRECLIFALLNNEKCGVFGGHSVDDRKAFRKKWTLRSGKTPRPEWDTVFDEDDKPVYAPGEPASWYAPEDLKDPDD